MPYQIPQEIPLLGAHVVKPYSPIHEATHCVPRGQREGLVLGEGGRWYCLTGGGSVVVLCGGYCVEG